MVILPLNKVKESILGEGTITSPRWKQAFDEDIELILYDLSVSLKNEEYPFIAEGGIHRFSAELFRGSKR